MLKSVEFLTENDVHKMITNLIQFYDISESDIFYMKQEILQKHKRFGQKEPPYPKNKLKLNPPDEGNLVQQNPIEKIQNLAYTKTQRIANNRLHPKNSNSEVLDINGYGDRCNHALSELTTDNPLEKSEYDFYGSLYILSQELLNNKKDVYNNKNDLEKIDADLINNSLKDLFMFFNVGEYFLQKNDVKFVKLKTRLKAFSKLKYTGFLVNGKRQEYGIEVNDSGKVVYRGLFDSGRRIGIDGVVNRSKSMRTSLLYG